MADQEDIRLKNQQAAEAMKRARQAQIENARMQRELRAAARELARHQEEAAKAREAAMAAEARMKAAAQSARQNIEGMAESDMQQREKRPQAGSSQGTVAQEAASSADISQEEYWAGGRKAAEQRAAQQRAILQAAERRQLKKQAAEEAAALVAKQRAQEKQQHHTSPETKQLQNLLLQQIAEIMEDEKDAAAEAATSGKVIMPEAAVPRKPVLPEESAPQDIRTPGIKEPQENLAELTEEAFGDLVFLDSNGEETKPEPSNKTTVLAQEINDRAEEEPEKEPQIEKWGRMGQWFQTLCWMHIPVIGFLYLLVVAIRKKTPVEKKAFARAYILYRVLVWVLALTILYSVYQMGLGFVEEIISYIDMHL